MAYFFRFQAQSLKITSSPMLIHEEILTRVFIACTNKFLWDKSVLPINKSSIRPGVPMMIWPPSFLNFSMSVLMFVPPIKSCCFKSGTFSRKFASTSDIWEANSRVGDIIKAPIWWIFSVVSNFESISNIGIKKARVFPLPVTASAATSFRSRNNGIVAAWKKRTQNYGFQILSRNHELTK